MTHAPGDTRARALDGRYVLVRAIGHGGMANVYLAEDRKQRRDVAITVLRPALARSVGADRFARTR